MKEMETNGSSPESVETDDVRTDKPTIGVCVACGPFSPRVVDDSSRRPIIEE